MKVTINTHVSGRTSDGRAFAAGEGTRTVVEDGDEPMVALMREWAAKGAVQILDDKDENTDPGEDEPKVEDPDAPDAPAEDPDAPDDDVDYREVQQAAKDRGLPATGTKEELAERVAEYDADPERQLEQARTDAEAAGVKVDGRWGADRIREEIAAQADPGSSE